MVSISFTEDEPVIRWPSLLMDGVSLIVFPAKALRKAVAEKSPTPASVMALVKREKLGISPFP